MLRYMAFIWNPEDPEATHAADDLARSLHDDDLEWREVLRTHGLTIHCIETGHGPDSTYLLHPGTGVVIGRLFERDFDEQSHTTDIGLSARSCSAIADSQGRVLLTRYWGRYVAFLHDCRTLTTRVIRDPTGGVPCLKSRLRNIDLVYCRQADYERVAGTASSINWRHVRAFLAYGCLPTDDTGFNGISQIRAGESVAFARGRQSSLFYWNPLSIATTASIEDPALAAAELRRTAASCSRAWASLFPAVVLKLSGGLDSSIVLACLRTWCTDTRVTGLNLYSRGSNCDERLFARRLAARFRIALVELERDSGWRWQPLLSVPRCPLPFSYFGYAQYSRTWARLARDSGATAIFSGNGGDLVFHRHASFFPAADYLTGHGLTRRYFKIALDTAELSRMSIWSVFSASIRQGLLGQTQKLLPELDDCTTLMPGEALRAAQSDDANLHPLYRDIAGVPPGKACQAFMTTFSLSPYYNPFEQAGDPAEIAPLLSQPMVELCLRIPSYVHAAHARDRCLARQAFARYLPTKIVTRRAKGGMEEHTVLALKNNMDIARRLLVDGRLVHAGLLDSRRLDMALSGHPGCSTTTVEIYRYINAEAWLRAASAPPIHPTAYRSAPPPTIHCGGGAPFR